MRFPLAPALLRGIRVRKGRIELGGHRWVKNPAKALPGGWKRPQSLAMSGNSYFSLEICCPGSWERFFPRGWDPRILEYRIIPESLASVSEQGCWVVLDEFLLKCLGLKGLSWEGLEGWD